MDMGRASSSLTSQPKDISILMVHNDPMYQNIVSEILENCRHYQGMTFPRIDDALDTLRERKESLGVILTDMQSWKSDEVEILRYIKKEFKVRITIMQLRENAKLVSIGPNSSATLYFIKLMSQNEFEDLWCHAYTKEKGKAPSVQSVSIIHEKEGMSLERQSSIQEVTQRDQGHKRKAIAIEDTAEQSEEDRYNFPRERRPRLVWDQEMHLKFLKAVEELGVDKAYPKEVMESMNIPGLTRENVASHLQKYRIHLKGAREDMHFQSSHAGLNLGHQKSILGNYQESLKSTYAINQSLTTKTGNNRISINNSFQILETENNKSFVNIQVPRSKFSDPNHSEMPSGISNFVHDGSLLSPYTNSPSLLEHKNPQTDPFNNTYMSLLSPYPNGSSLLGHLNPQPDHFNTTTYQSPVDPYTHSSPLIVHENPQPDPFNTTTYQGLIDPYTHSSPHLVHENPQPDPFNNTTYQGLIDPYTHSSPHLVHENPQPDPFNNTTYQGLIDPYTHSSPHLVHENPQPDPFNTTTYQGLIDPYTHSSPHLVHGNPQPDPFNNTTYQSPVDPYTHSSLIVHENPQPDPFNTTTYQGLIDPYAHSSPHLVHENPQPDPFNNNTYQSPIDPYTHSSPLLVHENPQPNPFNTTTYQGLIDPYTHCSPLLVHENPQPNPFNPTTYQGLIDPYTHSSPLLVHENPQPNPFNATTYQGPIDPYTHSSPLLVQENPRPDPFNATTYQGPIDPYTHSSPLLVHENPQPDPFSNTTCQSPVYPDTHNSPLLVHENPQPDPLNNTNHVGFELPGNNNAQNYNDNTNDRPYTFDEGTGNGSLAQFPSTEAGDNGENQFYYPPVVSEFESLFGEFGGGGASPQNQFDF